MDWQESCGRDDLSGAGALVLESAESSDRWQNPVEYHEVIDHLKGSGACVGGSIDEEKIRAHKEAKARHDHLIGAASLVEDNGRPRPIKVQAIDHLLGSGSIVQGVVTPYQGDDHEVFSGQADHLLGASAAVIDDSSSSEEDEDEGFEEQSTLEEAVKPLPVIRHERRPPPPPLPESIDTSSPAEEEEEKQEEALLPAEKELLPQQRSLDELCDLVRAALRHSTAKILTLRRATQELRTHANPGTLDEFQVVLLLQRLRLNINLDEAQALLVAAGCPNGVPSSSLSKLATLFVDGPRTPAMNTSLPPNYCPSDVGATLSHDLPIYKYVMTDPPVSSPRRAHDEYHHLEEPKPSHPRDVQTSQQSSQRDLEHYRLAQQSLEFNTQLRNQIRENNLDSHRLALAIKAI